MEVDVDSIEDNEFVDNPVIDEKYEANSERRWRLSYLKDQFETLELQNLFDRYIQRISHGYFSQFLSLQIILVTSHFIILLVAEDKPDKVLPDVILYGLISVLSVILLIITDKYVKDHPKLLKYLAGTAFVIIFFNNAFIPFYYRDMNLRPAYTIYLIISNYIFFNIQNIIIAIVMGLFVSISHTVMLILVTYKDKDEDLIQELGSDIIYLICINGLGVYFRYMNEIVIRRSFLDRRSCVVSTHQLNFEDEQEDQLMSSIIPKHIIGKVKKDIMEHWLSSGSAGTVAQRPFEDLYVEHHPNVSILFADIVNYTAMTTQLKITGLLDTLDELFGRFDDASKELKVLRIKFLGDCYYCVSGLPPDPPPNHAEACVDLGLKMIGIIADIRQRRNLNINMRIGIHTGKISSGIIGAVKWQYDIWSTDVDIANRMETEGEPGKVHITKQTRDLLKKSYNISVTDKIINNERTFLITPYHREIVANRTEEKVQLFKEISETKENNSNQRRATIFMKRNSTVPKELNANSYRSISLINNYRQESSNNNNNNNNETEDSKPESGKRHTFPSTVERRLSGIQSSVLIQRRANGRISAERRLTNDNKRRTAFMNNNIKRYKERLEETNKELEQTIENMLLSKYEQWFKISDMHKFLLIFKNFSSEIDFVKMPDPLFKYYLLSEFLLVIVVFILQNLSLSSWNWPTWHFYLCLGTIILFLPLSWTHHLWSKYIAKSEIHIPKNRFIRFLYNASKFITNSILARFVIYTVVYILFCMCVLTEWLDCFQIIEIRSNNLFQTKKESFLNLLLNSQETLKNFDAAHCTIPWHMTETCALAIIMSFLFLRMYMWLKLLYASTIAILYSICIIQFSGSFYGDSQTYNYMLEPQTSHIVSVIFLTLILHLVDRQTEYMNRLDHLWYKSLTEQQKQANDKHIINTMLLNNILPKHVADIYLNLNRKSEEFYFELYPEAAVMFASITNFSVETMGQNFLKAMNLVIKEFDMLLLGNTFGCPIEKIKIAKWTYMAACGLVPGLGNAENIKKDQNIHVVISLLKFAASLMQKLKNQCNFENSQEMKLRIGIAHGLIAAGVVGSKKPLYDIWGDPVNMASRMDTTGIPDHIQVLQPTAEIIQRFGYICYYRGEIRVKGRDHLVPTYFVALDEDFNLKKQEEHIQNNHGNNCIQNGGFPPS